MKKDFFLQKNNSWNFLTLSLFNFSPFKTLLSRIFHSFFAPGNTTTALVNFFCFWSLRNDASVVFGRGVTMRFFLKTLHWVQERVCILFFHMLHICSLSRQYNLVSLYPHLYFFIRRPLSFFYSDYHTSGKTVGISVLEKGKRHTNIYFLYIIFGTLFHKSKYGEF